MGLRILGWVGAVAMLAVAAAFVLAPGRSVVTTMQINTPPGKVWAVLVDLPGYPHWNPEMRLIGRLSPGVTIENIEAPGTSGQMVFWPVVMTADPDRELRWEGHLLLYRRLFLPRILDAQHYFLLRPDAGGTLFIQGEQFRGVLLWAFDVRQLLPGFNAMNAALKARAEAL